MPIKVAIKTTLNALSNESAAFPRLRCTLHVRPKTPNSRVSSTCLFLPFPSLPTCPPRATDRSSTSCEWQQNQEGTVRSQEIGTFRLPRSSQVCHRAVNPGETPNRFKGEMRGHVWGGRNVPKSYGAFVVEVQASKLGPSCDLRPSAGRETPPAHPPAIREQVIGYKTGAWV